MEALENLPGVLVVKPDFSFVDVSTLPRSVVKIHKNADGSYVETISGSDNKLCVSKENNLNERPLSKDNQNGAFYNGAYSSDQRPATKKRSALCVEVVKNGVQKYYIIPTSLAKSDKWKLLGKTLHIFKNHTFAAKHFFRRKSCSVCAAQLPYPTLRKQGYQCRDCKLICHKECHVNVPKKCPNTTVFNVDIEYYQNGNNVKIDTVWDLLEFLACFS